MKLSARNALKHNRLPKQNGAVLIVALVLLLVLTVLGTSGIQNTAMEERMTGNFRDLSEALQGGENGIRFGEVSLSSVSSGVIDFANMDFENANTTYDGIYSVTSVSINPLDESINYYTLVVPTTATSPGVGQPTFYIESLPPVPLPGSDLVQGFQDTAPVVQYYRVTGRGLGLSPNAEVILQSTYFR